MIHPIIYWELDTISNRSTQVIIIMENKAMVYAVVALLVGAAVGVGIGYMMFNDSESEEYGYYLYFGENDTRNGWYVAEGIDAADAFDKAMNDAGMKYEVGSSGYVNTIDDTGLYWAVAQYLYSATDKAAAEGSILSPVKDQYGSFSSSNGWKNIAGYGSAEENKLSQFESNYFFMSVYAEDWTFKTPIDVTDWMTTGPFA